MFKELHALALAQGATLMITINAEDDACRVTLTPTPLDGKSKPTLKPLSLIAPPEELDEQFAEVITAWQAPRKSLIEQVTASNAAEDDDDNDIGKEKDKPAAKPAAKKESKPAAASKAKPEAKAASKKTDKAKTTLNPAAQWPFPGTKAATDAETEDKATGTSDVDPRQTSLIEGSNTDGGSTPPTESTPVAAEEKQPEAEPVAPAASAAPTFEIELF